MRKSFFGHRPLRGKLHGAKSHGGKREDQPGSRGPRSEGKGGHEKREGRGASSGTRFGERSAGGGSRDERKGGQGARGGGGESASRMRFKKRMANSGARNEHAGEARGERKGEGRDERKAGQATHGGRKVPYGSQFRARPASGAPRGEREDRGEARGGRGSPSGTRFGQRLIGRGSRGERNKDRGETRDGRGSQSGARFPKRPAGGAARGERAHGPEVYAGRGGPPPGVRVRERPASKGSRYDRMDRPERQPSVDARVRRRGPGGKPLQVKEPSVSEPMRIAKAMARAGLCSRREAERWIAEGRVSINGQVLKTPGVEVKPKDRVLVDGKPMPVAEPSQLWRYNKPKGLVTTHDDPQGRPTVFDNLPPGLPRVISVGRLDFNTEGLILLTNDGELARHLELPATGWLRRYRVRAKGRVTQVDLDKLKEGVEVEGVRYGPVEATIDTVQGANMWITVGIREGKNREVRKVLESLGLEVNRLIRISFGPFQLLELEPGEAEVIKRRVLADQLGPQLAAEFGLVEKDEEKQPGKKKGGGGGRQQPRAQKRKDEREDD